MTISTTKLTDNSFNIIVKANGVGSEEEQTLVDVVNSNNATSEPKVSIADIHYEILGTGKCTIFFKNDIEKKVEIEGRGNYGLKPTEDRIKDAIGDILLTSDSNVTKYNVVIETKRIRIYKLMAGYSHNTNNSDTSGVKFVDKLTNFSDGTGETLVKKVDVLNLLL